MTNLTLDIGQLFICTWMKDNFMNGGDEGDGMIFLKHLTWMKEVLKVRCCVKIRCIASSEEAIFCDFHRFFLF